VPFCAVILFFSGNSLQAQAAEGAVVSDGTAARPTTGSPAPQQATLAAPGQAPEQQIDKRIFGVLPNYRTASGSAPYMPITAKQKFWIAARDSFDKPVYITAGAFAGLYQLENQNPSWGQGMEGYAKRYGAALADQAIGNIMTEGAIPSLIHQDPRYFRMGTGKSAWHRTLYALNGVNRAKFDSGKWGFNYSEWLGNGSAVAISNLYYPSDTRNVHDNVDKLLVAVATDSFSNVLKEFWPDIKQKYFHKKKPAQ